LPLGVAVELDLLMLDLRTLWRVAGAEAEGEGEDVEVEEEGDLRARGAIS